VQRQLVQAAIVTAALIGFAAAALSTVENARPAETRTDAGVAVVRKIERYQRATWRWQRVMGVARAPTRKRYLSVRNLRYRLFVMHRWRRRAIRARHRAHHPPHARAWRCLQRFEAAWNDGNDPYWGGLQMDRGFMRQYAPRHLLRRGWANEWTPVEQMWVAERALQAGRGFYPWPNAGRMCGLI